MANQITKRDVHQVTIQGLTLFLLVLYLAGTSHLEWLHSLAHDHSSLVRYSEKQAEDPCHRLIYYNDKEQGCDHDLHLIVSDKCHMCDHNFQCAQSLVSPLMIPDPTLLLLQFWNHKDSLDSYRAVVSSSRAPPDLT